MAERLLMDRAAIREALDRMTAEMVRRFPGARGLALVGIRTRGEFLAKRFQAALDRLEHARVPVGALDITVYRDDFDALQDEIRVRGSQIDFDPRGRHVVLVDDVLFTGRTIRAAMDALVDYGRPRAIRLAVLIDRGHRELPIRADHVGKNVPTQPRDDVRVHLVEVDGRDEVELVKAEVAV